MDLRNRSTLRCQIDYLDELLSNDQEYVRELSRLIHTDQKNEQDTKPWCRYAKATGGTGCRNRCGRFWKNYRHDDPDYKDTTASSDLPPEKPLAELSAGTLLAVGVSGTRKHPRTERGEHGAPAKRHHRVSGEEEDEKQAERNARLDKVKGKFFCQERVNEESREEQPADNQHIIKW
jgi:hypothetical protein